MPQQRRIGVIGAGVAGLSAAWLLSHRHQVCLLEAGNYVGGHSNTVQVHTPQGDLSLDTGFVVFNNRNYPNLVQLFDWLGVDSLATEMSFAVSARNGEYEYAGSNLNTLFGQRDTLLDPGHWRLLLQIVRFNRHARAALARGIDDAVSLGEFLQSGEFGERFQHAYLLPMGAAIWSCPAAAMRAFPARSFLAFFLNHGLLDLTGRPQWRTVRGGSQSYVEKMLRRLHGRVRLGQAVERVERHPGGVTVHTGAEPLEFDDVVFGCHADQALKILAQPSHDEQRILGAFRYQQNRALLHSDPGLMPRNRRVWSAWNYLSRGPASTQQSVYVSYWMNRLQHLPGERQFFVSLNPLTAPRDDRVLAEFDYAHPVFDAGAIAAQPQLHRLQGVERTWYCGSYFGNGFHEDAYTSALRVAQEMGVAPPWRQLSPEPASAAGSLRQVLA